MTVVFEGVAEWAATEWAGGVDAAECVVWVGCGTWLDGTDCCTTLRGL